MVDACTAASFLEVTAGMGIKDVLKRVERLGALLTMFALLIQAGSAWAAAGNNALKIYEVAGAGGLSGANYRQDTIILFNPTTSTITCDTCAVQTHSGTSNTAAWTIYKLPSISIPAGGYYMIAASSQQLSTSGAVAPIAYDYQLQSIEDGGAAKIPTTQNILSSTIGVVALTNSQTALTGSSASLCATGSQLVDLVGYGSSAGTNSSTSATPASCFAGVSEANYDGSSAFGQKLGVIRKNECIDTFNNADDWVNAPVVYFNSTSTPTPCPAGTQLSAATIASPTNPAAGGAITVTAAVTVATQPSSSNLNVTLNFNTSYYPSGAALQMYDDGTHGDAVAGDGVYSLTTTIPSKTASGFTYPLTVTVTDTAGDSYTGYTPLAIGGSPIGAGAGNNNLRIIAWYGAGNLSKSMYARDTVILFNPTQSAITMNNWSLQTGGTTGSFSTVYKLPVATIPAGGFYAIAGSGIDYISSAGCVGNVCNLTYPYDYQLKTVEGTATSTDNDLSSTAVTVALVNSQTALPGTCPLTSPNLVDLIGVGAVDGSSPVSCYAGSGYAPYTPSTLSGLTTNINGVVYAYATVRKNRCTGSFDNANDFILGPIDFANSTTTPVPCPIGTQAAVTNPQAAPNSPGVLDPFLITAQVNGVNSPGNANMDSTGLMVTADLSALGLSVTTPLYDDGTHGDAMKGDGVYSLSTAPAAASVGFVPGVDVKVTDAQGNVARGEVMMSIQAGSITMTSPTTTGTVSAGGVLTFPITVAAKHGYSGVLSLSCTGSPDTNALGIPVATQCLTTPAELTLSPDGSSTVSLAIATGLTTTAGVASRSLPLTMIGLLSAAALAFGLWRKRRLPAALLAALVTFIILGASGCGKSAGLSNVTATPGTYTYVVTATDSAVASISSSMTFKVTVQ
jgi:hypothetical protein